MLTWLGRLFCGRMLRRLRELQDDTDGVLESAYEVRSKIGGAVNWGGNLHCYQAEDWIDGCGDRGRRVWIANASPGATELQLYVRTSLHERGWHNIEVRCEW